MYFKIYLSLYFLHDILLSKHACNITVLTKFYVRSAWYILLVQTTKICIKCYIQLSLSNSNNKNQALLNSTMEAT